MSTSQIRHLARRVTGFLFGNPVAWLYLALVAASIVFTVVALATGSPDDPNFAGVWPFFATMPWSLIMIGFVSDDTTGFALVAIVVLGTLANLATIGALMHVVRHSPAPRPLSGSAPTP